MNQNTVVMVTEKRFKHTHIHTENNKISDLVRMSIKLFNDLVF